MKQTKSGFSIIEVLVSILVFSLGLVSIFTLIFSTLRLNEYNQNFIIASNLAREQVELIKNIRDSNYTSIHKWNQINPIGDYTDSDNFFQTGSYYTLENKFLNEGTFPVKVSKIVDFGEGAGELGGKMQDYKLYLKDNRYTYQSTGTIGTHFYRYMHIDEAKYMSGTTQIIIPNSYIVTSKVIWYKNGYHETELKTLLTDWKRL